MSLSATKQKLVQIVEDYVSKLPSGLSLIEKKALEVNYLNKIELLVVMAAHNKTEQSFKALYDFCPALLEYLRDVSIKQHEKTMTMFNKFLVKTE